MSIAGALLFLGILDRRSIQYQLQSRAGRELVLCTAVKETSVASTGTERNFECALLHVPGIHNNLADALSRQQVQRFKSLHPEANSNPDITTEGRSIIEKWNKLMN